MQIKTRPLGKQSMPVPAPREQEISSEKLCGTACCEACQPDCSCSGGVRPYATSESLCSTNLSPSAGERRSSIGERRASMGEVTVSEVKKSGACFSRTIKFQGSPTVTAFERAGNEIFVCRSINSSWSLKLGKECLPRCFAGRSYCQSTQCLLNQVWAALHTESETVVALKALSKVFSWIIIEPS